MVGHFYTCNLCGKEWKKVDLYGDGEPKMTTGNLTITYGAISTMEEDYTLTENDSEFHLCSECTNKLCKSLHELGFKGLYKGALMERTLKI